ncbi:uncharacterized protein LOC125099854 [Lutra lutra]|uniref:uncharacterized protein LOC125099854 n=1 Tax=Lutra lutra TaxID=9657 RepID=UPI001FD4FD15|nr:uncharacterized protein LOC125099854 [Lutra lutra]
MDSCLHTTSAPLTPSSRTAPGPLPAVTDRLYPASNSRWSLPFPGVTSGLEEDSEPDLDGTKARTCCLTPGELAALRGTPKSLPWPLGNVVSARKAAWRRLEGPGSVCAGARYHFLRPTQGLALAAASPSGKWSLGSRSVAALGLSGTRLSGSPGNAQAQFRPGLPTPAHCVQPAMWLLRFFAAGRGSSKGNPVVTRYGEQSRVGRAGSAVG